MLIALAAVPVASLISLKNELFLSLVTRAFIQQRNGHTDLDLDLDLFIYQSSHSIIHHRRRDTNYNELQAQRSGLVSMFRSAFEGP